MLPIADVEVVLKGPESVVVGEDVKIKATVTNLGPSPAEGIRITTLAGSTESSSVKIGSISCSGGHLVVCSLGTLEPDESRIVNVVLRPRGSGSVSLDFRQSSPTIDPEPENDTATLSVPVLEAADLVLTKSTTGTQVNAGSEFNYTLRIDNLGPSEATEVKIEEMLPEGLHVLGLTTQPANECEIPAAVETAGEVVPSLPLMIACKPLPVSQAITLELLVGLDEGVIGELVNRAVVTAAETDPDESNNSSSVRIVAAMKGDLNLDGVADALDVSVLVQEINDGDGEALADVADGTFPGTPELDLNGDEKITTDDIASLALLAFFPEEDIGGRPAGRSPQGGAGGSVLDFPRLSVINGQLTGIAIANPFPGDAPLTFRAYGESGQMLAETNATVAGGQQFSRLTSELFPGLAEGTVGWFQATSPLAGLPAFFLDLNFATFGELDGADLPPRALRIVFNTVQTSGGASTELNVVNPGDNPTSVKMTLVSQEGSTERNIELAPRGVARLDAAILFGLDGQAPSGGEETARYVLAESKQDIIGFQFVRREGGDLQGLNARSVLEQFNRIYIPQMAVLGGIESELGLVNYSLRGVLATVTAHKTNGDLFGAGEVRENPVVIALDPGQSIRRDVAELFGFQGKETVQGWIKIESTSLAINGFFSYRVPVTGASAVVSAVDRGATSAIFPHLASVGGFFTGVSALNPSSYPINLRIIALSVTGKVLGTFDRVLAPGQRIAELISGIIPGAADQGGGLILIRANYPAFFVSLFGTFNGRTLANIPPQLAPQAFRPDAGLPQARVTPPLSVIQPGVDQQFTVQGNPGPLQWSVNNVVGGSADTGTVTQEGFYSAPDGQPSKLPITISVEGDGLAAAASVDVLAPESLIRGLGIVQSLSFLEGLQRLYTAEFSVLGPTGSELGTQGSGSSSIFEIDEQGQRSEVLSLPGEDLSKIIPFVARDGQEYLLMAGRASGQIIRLDPQTAATRTVAENLAAPSAITFDSGGDLLVATATGISTVNRSKLEGDLPSATAGFEVQETTAPEGSNRGVTVDLAGIKGMQVDTCTGLIYLSLQAEGRVVAFNPSDNNVTEIAAGLGGPGHLLATYRLGVSCPESFNLIIIEETADQISLAIPSQGTVISPWVPAEEPLDLTIFPPSPFTEETSVLFNQLPAGGSGETNEVAGVGVGDLYEETAFNPPVGLATQDITAPPGPDLVVGTKNGAPGSKVSISVFVRPGEDDDRPGGSDEGNVLLFGLDYDHERFIFDASDVGADGIPDGVSSNLEDDFLVIVLHDPGRTDGELGFLVVDAEAPFTPLPQQELFDLEFTIRGDASGSAFLLLTSPGPQLVDVLSALQALDDVVNGGILIVP